MYDEEVIKAICNAIINLQCIAVKLSYICERNGMSQKEADEISECFGYFHDAMSFIENRMRETDEKIQETSNS